MEKPESDKGEGLCSVVSSKAKRLSRRKKGLVFNFPLKKAITVTGMHWSAALICGMEGHIKVAVMNWWSTKGPDATREREQEEKLLRTCIRQWGDQLLHIFDRGYASGKWLRVLQTFHLHFVIRWKKDHFFRDEKGEEKKLWQIGRGKRYRSHKDISDLSSHQKMGCDIWWAPVWHKEYTQLLYVVKVRAKRRIWYIITNERLKNESDAWEIVFAYKRRWQIELSFRYGKSELALESPRLWFIENRLKLLGMVSVVYAFLLHLLHPSYQKMIETLLRFTCHRTGKRCREASAPLYRLRWAISRLWEDARPRFGLFFPPNLEAIQALARLGCWRSPLKNLG